MSHEPGPLAGAEGHAGKDVDQLEQGDGLCVQADPALADRVTDGGPVPRRIDP